MRVLREHVHQSPAGLLPTNGDGSATKTLLQAGRPPLHRFRGILQFPLFMLPRVGWHQSPEILLVGPVDGYKCSPRQLGRYCRAGFRHCILPFRTGWLGSYESLIADSRNQKSSENSSRKPSASRCSKHFVETSSVEGNYS